MKPVDGGNRHSNKVSIPPEKSGGSVEAMNDSRQLQRPTNAFRLRNQAAPLKQR